MSRTVAVARIRSGKALQDWQGDRHVARCQADRQPHGGLRHRAQDARLDTWFWARFWPAKATRVVSLPGGCAIGARPMDIHVTALEKPWGRETRV